MKLEDFLPIARAATRTVLLFFVLLHMRRSSLNIKARLSHMGWGDTRSLIKLSPPSNTKCVWEDGGKFRKTWNWKKKSKMWKGLIESMIKEKAHNSMIGRKVYLFFSLSVSFILLLIATMEFSSYRSMKGFHVPLMFDTQKVGKLCFITSWLAFSDRNSPKTFSALLISAAVVRCTIEICCAGREKLLPHYLR